LVLRLTDFLGIKRRRATDFSNLTRC
jgi:hypothetical protein